MIAAAVHVPAAACACSHCRNSASGSIQVEIDKPLYMSEATLERHSGFDAVQRTLGELAEALLGQAPWKHGLRRPSA